MLKFRHRVPVHATRRSLYELAVPTFIDFNRRRNNFLESNNTRDPAAGKKKNPVVRSRKIHRITINYVQVGVRINREEKVFTARSKLNGFIFSFFLQKFLFTIKNGLFRKL